MEILEQTGVPRVKVCLSVCLLHVWDMCSGVCAVPAVLVSSNQEMLSEVSSKVSAQTSVHSCHFIVTLYSVLSGCVIVALWKTFGFHIRGLEPGNNEPVNVPREICFPYSLLTLESRV